MGQTGPAQRHQAQGQQAASEEGALRGRVFASAVLKRRHKSLSRRKERSGSEACEHLQQGARPLDTGRHSGERREVEGRVGAVGGALGPVRPCGQSLCPGPRFCHTRSPTCCWLDASEGPVQSLAFRGWGGPAGGPQSPWGAFPVTCSLPSACCWSAFCPFLQPRGGLRWSWARVSPRLEWRGCPRSRLVGK